MCGFQAQNCGHSPTIQIRLRLEFRMLGDLKAGAGRKLRDLGGGDVRVQLKEGTGSVSRVPVLRTHHCPWGSLHFADDKLRPFWTRL